jgi:hypothetical protein
MQITLSFDNFTELPYTSGTIQNISSQATVEICQDDTVNSGLILGPGEWFSWSNSTIYARSAWDYEPTATCAVVPFKKGGEGGGSEYVLPIASTSTLGGIKVGNGLQIDNTTGVLSSTSSPDNSVVPWTAGTEYKVGQYVIYNNQMYECTTANSDTTFNEDKWQLIGESSDIEITDWTAGKNYKVGDLAIYNNSLYKCDTANSDTTFDSSKWTVIGGVGTDIDNWQTSHDYEVGNLVIYDNKIYQCNTNHKSGTTFDTTKWTELGDAGNVQAWESGASYAVDDFAIYNNRLYKCTTANSDTTFDPDNWQDMGAIQHTVEAWESGKSYAVGDLVLKDNVIYKCTTANSDTTFDPNNWTVEIDNDKSVTPWVAGTDYAVGKYVVYNNRIWECTTANSDTTFDETKWTEISAATGIVLEQWADNTSYKTNQLVEHDGYAYLCIIAHTSTAAFGDDYDNNYWRRMPSYEMTGADSANDGVAGLVPQPKKTDVDKFLCADGTWKYAVAGVQAARVTLWEGSIGSLSGSGNVSLNLSDSVKNYDKLGFILTAGSSGQPRPHYNEIDTSQFDDLIGVTNSYMTLSWGYYNYSDYLEFSSSSTYTTLTGSYHDTIVTKIIGIKYIQPDSYSTEEKLIGTWIDGKPLYRKVFTPTGSGTDYTFETGLNGTNYNILRVYGYAKDGNNNLVTIPYYDGGTHFAIWIPESTGIAHVNSSTSNYIIKYVVIEYTKN